MLPNIYSEILDEFRPIADKLEDKGYSYKVYNNGRQFNVLDRRGVTQTYYPSTKTMVFHKVDGHGYGIPVPISFKNTEFKTFINYLNLSDDKIEKMFVNRKCYNTKRKRK